MDPLMRSDETAKEKVERMRIDRMARDNATGRMRGMGTPWPGASFCGTTYFRGLSSNGNKFFVKWLYVGTKIDKEIGSSRDRVIGPSKTKIKRDQVCF